MPHLCSLYFLLFFSSGDKSVPSFTFFLFFLEMSKRALTSQFPRSCFPYHILQQTRWADNDIYGHVNNTTYHAYADTVINHYLIHRGGLDIHEGSTAIGLCIENSFKYFSPITYPDIVWSGVRVKSLGTTSVTYEVGIFRNEEESISALGSFTHVFVDKRSRVKTPIPLRLREALVAVQVFPSSQL